MVSRRLSNHTAVRACLSVLAVFMVLVVPVTQTRAATATGKTFASPQEAVQAMVEAVKNNSTEALTAIFGPGSQPLVSSGDKVDDQLRRERFLKVYAEKNAIEAEGGAKAILHVGNDDFPFPIPLLKGEAGWYFDTEQGKEEILCRRIGRNELHVMDVLLAYTDAQREYIAKDRDEDGVLEFARKLISGQGKRDGLYWEITEGEEESPLGPLIAKASEEGFAAPAKSPEPEPFYGYYFKILTAQGGQAKGGAFDYIVKDHMILGFGMVAYPAGYGASGVMTFIVNQEGTIYQKDLRQETEKAMAMTTFAPDATWSKVEVE